MNLFLKHHCVEIECAKIGGLDLSFLIVKTTEGDE